MAAAAAAGGGGGAISGEQQARIDRMRREEFYYLSTTREEHTPAVLLAASPATTLYRVFVRGATNNVYTICLRGDYTTHCSCPDGLARAPALHVACKHVVFLVARVLRLDFDAAFYRRATLQFIPDVRAGVTLKLMRLTHGDTSLLVERGGGGGRAIVDAALTERFKAATAAAAPAGAAPVATDAGAIAAPEGAAASGTGTGDDKLEAAWERVVAQLRPLNPDDDLCAVCFDALVPVGAATTAAAAAAAADGAHFRVAARALLKCTRCNGLVHSLCMSRWIEHGRNICTRCNQSFEGVPLAPDAATAAAAAAAPHGGAHGTGGRGRKRRAAGGGAHAAAQPPLPQYMRLE